MFHIAKGEDIGFQEGDEKVKSLVDLSKSIPENIQELPEEVERVRKDVEELECTLADAQAASNGLSALQMMLELVPHWRSAVAECEATADGCVPGSNSNAIDVAGNNFNQGADGLYQCGIRVQVGTAETPEDYWGPGVPAGQVSQTTISGCLLPVIPSAAIPSASFTATVIVAEGGLEMKSLAVLLASTPGMAAHAQAAATKQVAFHVAGPVVTVVGQLELILADIAGANYIWDMSIGITDQDSELTALITTATVATDGGSVITSVTLVDSAGTVVSDGTAASLRITFDKTKLDAVAESVVLEVDVTATDPSQDATSSKDLKATKRVTFQVDAADPRSCHQIWLADPTKPSGDYEITVLDADGNDAQRTVSCDMDGNTRGVTDGVGGGWTLVYKIGDSSGMKGTGEKSVGSLYGDNAELSSPKTGKLSDKAIRELCVGQYRGNQWKSSVANNYCQFNNIDDYTDANSNGKQCDTTYKSNPDQYSQNPGSGWSYGFSTWGGYTGSIITQLRYGDSRKGSHVCHSCSSDDGGCKSSGGCHTQIWCKTDLA